MIVNYRIFEKVGEHGIRNVGSYLDYMSRSISNKLFFVNKVDFDCLIDVGAADGALLDKVHEIMPLVKLIGYDLDPHMVNLMSAKPYISATTSWDDVRSLMSGHMNVAVLMSSVLHEIYTYTNRNEITMHWNRVFGDPRIKHVIIRDMCMKDTDMSYVPDEIDVERVRDKANTPFLQSFEKQWGSIGDSYDNLVHFLLKYKYQQNWKRENKENYLAMSMEELKRKIPAGWKIEYEEHYVMEYLKDKIMSEFGVALNKPTHVKIILGRSDLG